MKTSVSSLFVAVVGFALAFGTGCAAKLQIRSTEPAKVNLGAANRISVVQSEGRRSAKEEVIAELISQARSGGHFTAADRTEEGLMVKVAGRNAEIVGATEAQAQDEVLLRVDVLEYTTQKDTKTVTKTDRQGRKYDEKVDVLKGKVLLAVTAVTATGRAVLAETEYEADVEGKDETSAKAGAVKQAVAMMLADITPKPVTRAVKLDEDDKNQKTIIKVARDGNIAQAIAETRQYLEQNPNNPAAHYNLAVYLDASGQYEEAIEHYNHALAGSTKKFYADAKAACAKRLADQQALAE